VPLILVRHAQAGSRSGFDGDDTLRPLTGRGRHQAADIAGLLLDLVGDRPVILRSSPYRRCVETVAPYAAATGLGLQVESWLAEGPSDDARGFVRSLASAMGERVEVWCSHGDIIPAILEMLAAQDDLKLGPDPRVQKGSIWILEVGPDDHYTAASYIGPTC
jgi:8-oxo-(d)GTP phosphatase